MNKKTDNRGLSLVELIVTITVMTVLVGILVPRFQVYINSRRQQACRANREALLNIFEKAVYDDQLLVAQTDLQMIIDASGTKMTTEYTNQAKEYLICPDAKETGHYSAHVTDNVAYITCDCHSDDVCTLTFDNWVAKADLTDPSIDLDPSYTIPAHSGPESEGSGDPEEEEVPPTDTTETVNTGIWPRVMDSQGRLDERWATAGAQPGSAVTINAPVHFIDTTGAEIVIVKGPYTVKYEDANYPLGHGANALPYVIATSGVKYTGGNLPAQIEEALPAGFVDEPVYGYVKYERKSITEQRNIYTDCKVDGCPDRNVKAHSHGESIWGYKGYTRHNETDCGRGYCGNRNKAHIHHGSQDIYGYTWGSDNSKDCPIVGCTKKNVDHTHPAINAEKITKETVIIGYEGPDCGYENCDKKNVETHYHYEQVGTNSVWKNNRTRYVYRVDYGDMLELNGVTYIYTVNSGGSNYIEGLPTATQTALGTDYNGWYVVPALTK